MLPLAKENVVKLASIINTSNTEERFVVHAGLAKAIEYYFLKNIEIDNFENLGFRFRIILEELNEVGIIDKDLLKSLIIKFRKAEAGLNNIDILVRNLLSQNVKSDATVLGIEETFTENELVLLKKHSLLYRASILGIKNIKEDLIKILSNRGV